MLIPRRALLAAMALAGVLPACRPDIQVARSPGRPKREALNALYAPSSYQGSRTTVKVGLGERADWELFCPGRLNLYLEDDPGQRVAIRDGVTLRATLEDPSPPETGLCPYLEITADVDSIVPAEVTAAFSAQGYLPHIEISGVRVRDETSGPDAVIDERHARLVLGPCTSPDQVERTCRKLIDSNQLACTAGPGVARAPGGTLVLRTSTGVDVARWDGPARMRCDGSDSIYLQSRGESGERGTYRDWVILTPGPSGKVLAINEVDLESYVKGVLPSEIFPDAPDAALEAQAVVARGYAIGALGKRHGAEPFDLCNDVHCQVYRGLAGATGRTETAVDATRGLVLMREGSLVDAKYHADCGGITEANEVAWRSEAPDPALRPVADTAPSTEPLADFSVEANLWSYLLTPPTTFCGRAARPGQHRWTRSLSAEDVARLIGPERSVGKVRGLHVTVRGVSGRATALAVEGSTASRTIVGELEIRRALGDLPSSAFAVQTIPAPNGEPAIFVLVGAGHGHGVGMCQTGAIGMALENASLSEILGHYYAGARVHALLP